MMKRRGVLLVIFSLGMAGFAAWAANGWVTDRLTLADSDANQEAVIVAALEIPYGTKVDGRHLRVEQRNPESVPEGAFRSLDDVEGMVATATMYRGEILVTTRFAQHASGSTLAALVASNMRAVTVRVDDVVGVAGFLLPGNRVDVLATRLDRRNRRARTETILKNIKVLAVDQTAATQENDPVIVRAVTLEMTPNQSENLVQAKEEGTIQLTLRNPLEKQQIAQTEPVVKKAPAIAVRPARKRTRKKVDSVITVIRGTHVNKTTTKS
jgi:pilus assembly protein CpaB